MTTAEFLNPEFPDPEAAERFLGQLAEKHKFEAEALSKNSALRSDVLMLVACSPLFAATLLQNPEHIAWLGRERTDTRVRDKQALLESLARFSLTHSQVDPHTILARFRRRELMRIFLRDVRRLASVAEITEEISNLADAILDHALRLSRQGLDNQFGQPQEQDESGRVRLSQFCVISLGKLGSRELNYSSDIDLLFVYSNEGKTSGTGNRGVATNIEYFSKLSLAIIKLVAGQGGEGAAYRVDLRLRPHGSVGPLALPLKDTIRYYTKESAAWERQVLIRMRSSAGSESLFRNFYEAVESRVFSSDISVEEALSGVGRSKQMIDLQPRKDAGVDIKLDRGGIREIEFIAQALQLAYGGNDLWLRAPHTLVSLDRLADRGYLTGTELTKLFDAYDYLRRLEHILQVENGLQTHLVPFDPVKRSMIAKRFGSDPISFDVELNQHLGHVAQIFERIFRNGSTNALHTQAIDVNLTDNSETKDVVEQIKKSAPRFLDIVKAHSEFVPSTTSIQRPFPIRPYLDILGTSLKPVSEFGNILARLRKTWYRQLIEIVAYDAFGKLELEECKRRQTALAEASIACALEIATAEVEGRLGDRPDGMRIGVLALGKLASGGLDYDSDLDLVFVHEDEPSRPPKKFESSQAAEIYSRVVETFTNVLSSITRDGSLYRVDLRLRPYGSDGPLVISRKAIIEYFRENAAVWEYLAYVKLRAVGGDIEFARNLENEIRTAIHERALQIDPALLAAETRALRDKLEKQKTNSRSKHIDIKYGAGGLLDVYFSIRYLQLRFCLPDTADSRATDNSIKRISVSISKKLDIRRDRRHSLLDALSSLQEGFRFLSAADHFIRLNQGRNSSVSKALRLKLNSEIAGNVGEFRENLALQRISIRDAFEICLDESTFGN